MNPLSPGVERVLQGWHGWFVIREYPTQHVCSVYCDGDYHAKKTLCPAERSLAEFRIYLAQWPQEDIRAIRAAEVNPQDWYPPIRTQHGERITDFPWPPLRPCLVISADPDWNAILATYRDT